MRVRYDFADAQQASGHTQCGRIFLVPGPERIRLEEALVQRVRKADEHYRPGTFQ